MDTKPRIGLMLGVAAVCAALYLVISFYFLERRVEGYVAPAAIWLGPIFAMLAAVLVALVIAHACGFRGMRRPSVTTAWVLAGIGLGLVVLAATSPLVGALFARDLPAVAANWSIITMFTASLFGYTGGFLIALAIAGRLISEPRREKSWYPEEALDPADVDDVHVGA